MICPVFVVKILGGSRYLSALQVPTWDAVDGTTLTDATSQVHPLDPAVVGVGPFSGI